MIARSWQATATPDGAGRYEEHFRDEVLPQLRALPGFSTAYLMRREDGDRDATGTVRIHVLTFWESMAAIIGFAGNRPNAAVVHPAAQTVLLKFDKTVDHYVVQQYPA